MKCKLVLLGSSFYSKGGAIYGVVDVGVTFQTKILAHMPPKPCVAHDKCQKEALGGLGPSHTVGMGYLAIAGPVQALCPLEQQPLKIWPTPVATVRGALAVEPSQAKLSGTI